MKLKRLGLVSCILAVSCSVEKVNLSPTSNFLSNAMDKKTLSRVPENMETKADFIKYSSEITNCFHTISTFSDKNTNQEVDALKYNISEYIYAIKEHNTLGKEKAFYRYETSYKKIQKLKKKLPSDEQEILNRFLVKIKTNVYLIKSLKQDNTL